MAGCSAGRSPPRGRPSRRECSSSVRGQAPTTITAEMVRNMKAGSVIVDLAASGGGNCELTVPGEKIVTDNGVTIIGYRDLTSRMPAHTSQLYGTNIVNLF